jgi:hypothetical protein
MYDANDIRLRISSEARRGDWQTVAELAGKSTKTVYAVTAGRRENVEVLQHFVELLDKRKKLKAAKSLATSQEAAQ